MRAKIVLRKVEGISSQQIAKELWENRRTVDLRVNKFRNRKKEDTIDTLLSVSKGRGCEREIEEEARTFIVAEACTKPRDLGYAVI